MDVKNVQVQAYQCGKCNKIYNNQYSAEYCCFIYHCDICNKELDNYHTRCKECREKVNFEKAEKIPLYNYSGHYYSDYYGYNKGFFKNINDLIEYCEDENIVIPKYVWACDELPVTINADDILYHACQEAYEGAIDNLKMVDELNQFCNEFNEANNHIITYYANYEIAILLENKEIILKSHH